MFSYEVRFYLKCSNLNMTGYRPSGCKNKRNINISMDG